MPAKRRRQPVDGVSAPQQETSLHTEEVWRGAEERLRAGTARREATKRRIETGQYQALDTPARLHARVNRVLGDPIARQEVREKGLELVASRGPGGDLNEFLLERIINGENFLGVNFFDLGKRAARCIGRIEIRTPDGRGGSGTGSMVSPRLLLTNHHVLQTAEWACQSRVIFDHEDDINGNPRQTVTFEFNPEAFFLTDAALDFTLVAVEESSLQPQGRRLSEYGFNPLDPAQGKIINGECINIIQHPSGMHKQVILQDNQLLDLREDSPWLHYEADTLPGSSGAPLFNSRWEMIGVHHAGWPRRDREGRILTKEGRIWTREMGELAIDWLGNEGARISRIVAAASAAYPSMPSAQQALLDALFTPPKRGTVVAPTGPRTPTPHAFDSWRGDWPVMPAAQTPIPQASGLDTMPTDQPALPTETQTAPMPATSEGGEIRLTIPLHVTIRLGTPTIDSRQTTPLPPRAAPVPLGRPSRVPGLSIHLGSGSAPPTPLPTQPGLVFEGFATQVSRGRDQHTVQQAVSTVLGPRWTIRPFGDHPTDFEVTKDKGALAVDAAWEATYRLRAQPGIVYAEPLFAVTLGRTQDGRETPAPPRVDPTTGRPVAEEAVITGLCTEPEPLPESHDIEWSLKQVRVFQAWARFFPDPSRQPGSEVVIGHPDTGYRRHPEIVDNLLIERGYDFVDDDPDAEDELEDGPLLNPGHGTQTASVIISPKGPPAGSPSAQAVTGVAPGAQLIPIRTGRSVITLISSFNLAHAIEHAADQGAHVISISMGGIFNWRLRQAILYAQERGVIVLAAAGNCVSFVVWPAAYDEVIAVAACNARHEIWRGSSQGSSVDVTAPGESVWRAHVDERGHYSVRQGSGTSYAVATAAGAAALWLARHGRQALIERYGIEKIPLVFHHVLQDSCERMPQWEEGQFGAGLLNVENLLAAELPDLSVPLAFEMESHGAIDNGGLPTFAHLFEHSARQQPSSREAAGPAPEAVLTRRLAALLRTTAAELPARLREVGQELAFHLATNPELYQQFAQMLSGTVAPGQEAEGMLSGGQMAAMRQALGVRASTALGRQLDRGA